MLITGPTLEILLPVHNEGDSIEHTIREIYDELSPHVPLQFIVCEDGSVDNTKSLPENNLSTFMPNHAHFQRELFKLFLVKS